MAKPKTMKSVAKKNTTKAARKGYGRTKPPARKPATAKTPPDPVVSEVPAVPVAPAVPVTSGT